MMRFFLFFVLIFIFPTLGSSQVPANAANPTNLTTDLLEHTDRVFLDGYRTTLTLSELGSAIERYQTASIPTTHPYMGWVMNSPFPNTLQTAYRIEVASSERKLTAGEADVWDSGRVESGISTGVRYGGDALRSSTVYFWRVKTWDNHGNESPFSMPKAFLTAPVLDGGTAVYPLQITDEYPIRIDRVSSGTAFIDFGKAAFGRLKLTLRSESGYDTVVVRLGEAVREGRVDRNPGAESSIRHTEYRLPLSAGIHTYTLKFRPDGRNTARKQNESGVDPIFMPDYTGEVYPFRYCEVEGYTFPLTGNQVVRGSVHYPFNDLAADFHSSDTVLNRVWELCRYSIKATSFLGVYVDGDRERIPYEADAVINQLCHYLTDREFSMARRTHEHLILNPTWPTEWHLQSVLIAWNDYLYTANPASLEGCYEDLKAKTLMALKEENGLISTRTDKKTPAFYETVHFRGDRMRDIVDWPLGEQDGYVKTDFNTVVNAFHYEAVRLMARIAEVLGREDDRSYYESEAGRVKEAFNRLLFDRRRGVYRDGIGTDHSSLHANLFPMAFGLVPDNRVGAVSAFIRSRGMACSVYGSQFLLDAVYNALDAEYGMSLLASTDTRGWYNMLRAGSTITMEAWDNRFKPNQDWNHAWGAAPANLIPRRLMGIEPLEPGYRRIRIKPQPGSLREASVKVPTIRGDVRMSFENRPGELFSMEVEVPANSTAEVWLPVPGRKYGLRVDGIEQAGVESEGFVKTEIGSGKHTLTVF